MESRPNQRINTAKSTLKQELRVKKILKSIMAMLAVTLYCGVAHSNTLTFSDPITGAEVCSGQRPAGDRVSVSSAGSMASLWLVFDGQEVPGLRLSLVGSNARNLIVDADGADVSGGQFILNGASLLNTRVQAYNTAVGSDRLVYAVNRGTNSGGVLPLPPLVSVLEGWPTEQSPGSSPWADVVQAGSEAFERGSQAGLTTEQTAVKMAAALRQLGL
jgi:hypothetical protein